MDVSSITKGCNRQVPLYNSWPSKLEGLLYYLTISVSLSKIVCGFRLTDGYSGSDLANLAKDAAMGLIRSKIWLDQY